jgi:predicted lipid-binding transport protein (Tim44 family)
MFLGTPRRWWIAAGLLFGGALVLIGTDTGGTLGKVVGVLLLFASIGIFGMSPMRYGQGHRQRDMAGSSPRAAAQPPNVVEPSRPRPAIEAGDPSDV